MEAEVAKLRLDLPWALPSLERPLSSQQGIVQPLKLQDLPDLLGQRQPLALASEIGLPLAQLGDQLRGGSGTEANRRGGFRARAHVA